MALVDVAIDTFKICYENKNLLTFDKFLWQGNKKENKLLLNAFNSKLIWVRSFGVIEKELEKRLRGVVFVW
jgi:predicted nucleotidyltransferase